MNTDLKVALALWINAWEAVTSDPSTSQDFVKHCYNLAKIADEEVEKTVEVLDTGFAVPTPDRLRDLLLIVIKWDRAHKILNGVEGIEQKHYDCVERLETDMRRFLGTCKHLANGRIKHDA